MIAGLEANDAAFLADLSNLENRITQVNKQVTSGFRVNQPSDDPAALAPIIAYQGQIDHITQVQTNLNQAQTEAQTADGTLQTASTLLNQLVSIASRGASSTTDAAGRASLGQQVQQIQQQLVALANTSVNGRYIFGGDDSSVAPYSSNWSSPGGVIQNTAQANTETLRDSDGAQIIPRQTALQIFDSRDANGAPTTGNIFQAAFSLGTSLLANNQSGVQSALDQVKAGVAQLGQATTAYGNIETWMQQASTTATSHLSTLTSALTTLRDSDVATDATQLTLSQTALQAAIAAHASINTKSLFSYLG